MYSGKEGHLFRSGQETRWAEIVDERTSESGLGEWAKSRRLEYLRTGRSVLLGRLRENRDVYVSMVGRDECLRPLVDEAAGKMLRQLRNVDAMIRAIVSPMKGDVTPDMIARAREYPIGELVDARNGRAVCVFHEGAENRNMDVRNGFAYCHKCGASGDAIAVYRKMTGASFPHAVKMLTLNH